jgi:hypothetical protein
MTTLRQLAREHQEHPGPVRCIGDVLVTIFGDGCADLPNDPNVLAARLLGVDPSVLTDDRHIIEFRNDGWTIQHPARERLNDTLFDCDMAAWDGGDLGLRGRYVLVFDEDGVLCLGDQVGE